MNKYLFKGAASAFLAAASISSPTVADAMDIVLSVDAGADIMLKGLKIGSSGLKNKQETLFEMQIGGSVEMFVTEALSVGASVSTSYLIPAEQDVEKKAPDIDDL